MSKYFTNTDNITVPEDLYKSEKITTPLPDIPPEQNKILKNDHITTTNPIIDEIREIHNQNELVNKTMAEINEINPTKIEETFKTFKPAELFERLNQITFIMIEMNNRLTAIEAKIIPTESKNISSPKEQFMSSTNKVDKYEVQNKLDNIKHGKKKIPDIPSESYIDNGVKLEEMFPNQSSEAFQAAYESMDEEESVYEHSSKSPRGGMSGINF